MSFFTASFHSEIKNMRFQYTLVHHAAKQKTSTETFCIALPKVGNEEKIWAQLQVCFNTILLIIISDFCFCTHTDNKPIVESSHLWCKCRKLLFQSALVPPLAWNSDLRKESTDEIKYVVAKTYLTTCVTCHQADRYTCHPSQKLNLIFSLQWSTLDLKLFNLALF